MAVADTEPTTPDIMLAFYRRLYPFKSLLTWLNHEHAPTKLFTHREFAFTLQGDVYLRYQSFANAEELKQRVCALNPTRFEIGPVYSARVSDSCILLESLLDAAECSAGYLRERTVVDDELSLMENLSLRSPETRRQSAPPHSALNFANLSSISI